MERHNPVLRLLVGQFVTGDRIGMDVKGARVQTSLHSPSMTGVDYVGG